MDAGKPLGVKGLLREELFMAMHRRLQKHDARTFLDTSLRGTVNCLAEFF
jgi:hypothetical protein